LIATNRLRWQIHPIMSSENLPKPTIRPPDLPKVQIPAPMPPPASAGATGNAMPEGGVRVNVRVAEGDATDEPGELRAPFNPRFIAAVIDLLITGGVFYSVFWIMPGSLEWLAWPAGIASWVLRDSLALTNGRSIGKSTMKLQAVELDGSSLVGKWRTATIRNLPFIILPFLLVELIVLLTREEQPTKRGRLGDDWAKTKVVVVPEPEAEEAPKAK
jgi:uncharacterized RDD family membrane protein YckC